MFTNRLYLCNDYVYNHRWRKGGTNGLKPLSEIETELIMKIDQYSLIEQSNSLTEQSALEILGF